MLALINRLLDWFRSLFWKGEMELTLVGLQYSGKTTFVNVIASGQFSEDMIPTVGFNMRKVTKGNVTIKIWDIGGQPRFRSMWERYCRGVNAIVYMVDAADWDKIEPSRNELHNLLDKPQLQGIPVLVLGNKRDLNDALDEKQLIEKMNLAAIQDREICCYSVSCKEKDNIARSGCTGNPASPGCHIPLWCALAMFAMSPITQGELHSTLGGHQPSSRIRFCSFMLEEQEEHCQNPSPVGYQSVRF
ncbi:hypothetical protein P4O66_006473 [Electrophorus voltai]|uniref:ADP-ribosylation factor-like 8Bb n=1 Tax=Electrophorus voltai TaxID=2609070 RepID=A0AAD8ZJA5_9TELE|nr:hypothetical protein P4O66_006473 [Electrophorus voltai]